MKFDVPPKTPALLNCTFVVAPPGVALPPVDAIVRAPPDGVRVILLPATRTDSVVHYCVTDVQTNVAS